MSDARISQDNDNIRKVLWYLKQVSPFAEGNSSIGGIATSATANKVEKMGKKYGCKYSLKNSSKVKTIPTKISVKLGSKGKATLLSDLLFQMYVFWQTVAILALTEMWKYSPTLFESTI